MTTSSTSEQNLTGKKENVKAEWIKKALQKDQLAYEKIVEATERDAYYIAYSMIHDSEEARDYVQEAYITAFGKLDQLKDRNNFRSWFLRILKNKIMDRNKYSAYKTEQMSDNFSVLDKDDMQFESLLRDDNQYWQPEEYVNYKEMQDGVHNIIQNELSADQRLVILAFYFEGQSIKEIAHQQNASVNNVKSWLFNGRKKIKEKIEELRQSNSSFYGVAPIPFLAWSMKQEAATIPLVHVSMPSILSSTAHVTVTSSASTILSSVKSTGSKVIHNTVISAQAACVVAGATIVPVIAKEASFPYMACVAAQYPTENFVYHSALNYDDLLKMSGSEEAAKVAVQSIVEMDYNSLHSIFDINENNGISIRKDSIGVLSEGQITAEENGTAISFTVRCDHEMSRDLLRVLREKPDSDLSNLYSLSLPATSISELEGYINQLRTSLQITGGHQ